MDLINFSETLTNGFTQYADFGFALLVGGICLRTLLFDREANTKQRAIWKHELSELEKSLRQLIDEATNASEVFDRQLNQRQKTIEKLVEKAESLLKASVSNAVKTGSRERSNTYDQKAKRDRTIEAKSTSDSSDWVYGDELPNHLRDPFEQTEEVIETKPSTNKSKKLQLANVLEATKDAENEQAIIDEKIFSQTSIVDPIAFRIAKRLLLEGKELHVIARKLEIPVSEIRHLEMLIRQHAQSDHVDLPETFKSKEIESVKKVIRDPAERKQKQKPLSAQVRTSYSHSNKKETDEYALSFEDDMDLPSELFR